MKRDNQKEYAPILMYKILNYTMDYLNKVN